MRDKSTLDNSIDPNGTGWQPFQNQFDSSTYDARHATHPAQDYRIPLALELSPVERPQRRAPSGNGFAGRVYGFQTRHQPTSWGDQEIWSFRVIRYDDSENRLPLPPVVVEMRGTAFSGFINDNDKVFVNERLREGCIVQTSSVFNITTATTVVAKDPTRKWILVNQLMVPSGFALLFCMLLAAVVVLIL